MLATLPTTTAEAEHFSKLERTHIHPFHDEGETVGTLLKRRMYTRRHHGHNETPGDIYVEIFFSNVSCFKLNNWIWEHNFIFSWNFVSSPSNPHQGQGLYHRLASFALLTPSIKKPCWQQLGPPCYDIIKSYHQDADISIGISLMWSHSWTPTILRQLIKWWKECMSLSQICTQWY